MEERERAGAQRRKRRQQSHLLNGLAIPLKLLLY